MSGSLSHSILLNKKKAENQSDSRLILITKRLLRSEETVSLIKVGLDIGCKQSACTMSALFNRALRLLPKVTAASGRRTFFIYSPDALSPQHDREPTWKSADDAVQAVKSGKTYGLVWAVGFTCLFLAMYKLVF